MKKVVTLFLLGLFAALAATFTTQAAEGDLIDLYPYDQKVCWEASSACTQTKVGSSHWTFEYAGYRYFFIDGTARFGHELEDKNSNGTVDPTEYPALKWNAFAVMTVNNTAETIVLSTGGDRTDITSSVHRIYSYFDETGKLAMVEDHFHLQLLKNEGTAEAPDWRLATAEEKTAYTAADPKPADFAEHRIRIKLDATDAQGYVIEPLVYLTWRKFGTTADTPIEDQSDLITGNPAHVTIPAGWTVVSFGTHDRGAYTATNLVKLLPYTMANSAYGPIVFKYEDQPAAFNNALGALDDDPTVPGINVVVEYKGEFTMPTDVTASWVDMFDTAGKIINKTEMLNYTVEIKKDDVVLQTITYTYDAETKAYTKSAEQNVIDTNVFGNGYVATFKVVTPTGVETKRDVDIVVGVMPPKFIGVAPRYSNEGVAIDLMKGITADDGYGNNITNKIKVTAPANFNTYYPQPGTYKIDLEFTHSVFIAGIASTINIADVKLAWDGQVNKDGAISAATDYMIFTDSAKFRAAATGYGSVMVYVNAEGKIKEWYDRYNWNHMTSTGTAVGDEAKFNAWKAAFTIEEGGFIIAAHGGVKTPAIRNKAYDTAASLTLGVPDETFNIKKTTSYVLTIDDLTAPVAMLVNSNYRIVVGQFTNVNQAILANVVAFDNADKDDVAMYVSNNGEMNPSVPGTYNVEVTVEDAAGNATVVPFKVTVLNDDKADYIAELYGDLIDVNAELDAAKANLEESQAAIDALEAQIAALQQQINQAKKDIEDLIEVTTVVPETGCGSAINSGSTLFITFSILLGTALIVFLKRRR